MRFQNIMLVATILLTACNATNKVSKQSLVNSDFLITTEHPWENTTVAVAPGENSAALLGSIVLSGGQNAHTVYTRNLFYGNATATIDTTTNASAQNFPVPDSTQDGTDNQIVRLKDGSIIAMRNSSTWKAMKNSPWWGNEKNINGRKGNRGAITFYRSTDAGNTWKFYSMIDFGSEALRKYGTPRPMGCSNNADVPPSQQCTDASGNKLWWIGGGDRTEMYACPFTGKIYVVTRIVTDSGNSAGFKDASLLFYSSDKGKTWTLAKDDLPDFESIVMTSTPDGRLFLFEEWGRQPTLFYSLINQPGLVISPPYPVYFSSKDSVRFPDTVSIDRLAVGTASISRASESTDYYDAVNLAYQATNSSNNQVYKILWAQVKDDSSAPFIIPVTTIQAANPAYYSVMHGAFIEPDFINIPSSVRSALDLFYWIEAPRRPDSPSYAKACFVKGINYTNPFFLSTKNNAPRNFVGPSPIGDYMKGAFFWYNNNYNYAAQWAEADGIHCNIISAKPDFQTTNTAKYSKDVIFKKPVPNAANIKVTPPKVK